MMKKILTIIILFFFSFSALAESSLDGVPGLIYLKNFATNQRLTADYAGGSNVITAVAPRSASNPDTWIDANGKINLSTTANTLLYDAGYYDTTGFHVQPGAHVYGTATNYILNSYFSLDANSDGVGDSWDSDAMYNPTLETCSINNIPNGKSQKTFRIYTTESGRYSYNMRQVTPNNSFDASTANLNLTVSFWARGNLTGLTTGRSSNYWISIQEVANDGTFQRTALSRTIEQSKVDGLHPTDWRRFSFTSTVTDTDTRKLELTILYFSGSDGDRPTTGENFLFEIYGVQIEKSSYATPFIPTTTAEGVRLGNVIRVPTSGNRNASAETAIIKFAPCSNFAKTYPGVSSRQLLANSTKFRSLSLPVTITTLSFKPNSSDSGTVAANYTLGGGDLNANILSVVAGSCSHTSPYANIYLNGVLKNSYTSGDFIDPAWGVDWAIGGGRDNNNWSDSTIQAIAIFNRKLTDAEVAKISNSTFTLNNGVALLMASE